MPHKLHSALVIAPPERMRDSLRVLLRASGVIGDIEQADDGPSGLQKLEQGSAPALVLLDAGLPDEQVWGTLTQMERNWPYVPCGVLVHSLEEEHRAYETGARFVLQADSPAETFFQALRDIPFEAGYQHSTTQDKPLFPAQNIQDTRRENE